MNIIEFQEIMKQKECEFIGGATISSMVGSNLVGRCKSDLVSISFDSDKLCLSIPYDADGEKVKVTSIRNSDISNLTFNVDNDFLSLSFNVDSAEIIVTGELYY